MFKNWIWLTISVALGIGLSFFMKNALEDFYSSEMIISSNAVTANEVISYTNKLHTFCLENNQEELAKALVLEQSKISRVKDIQAYWVIDKTKDRIPDYIDYTDRHNVSDTNNIRMTDRLAIRVKITTPGELTELRQGIFRFIENNQLFVKQNILRISQNEAMLARLNYDILRLDSLQKIKYFEETKARASEKGNQMVFLQEQKTQLIYEDIYKLYSNKQYYEKQRDIFSGVITLLSDFTVPLQPKNSTGYYAIRIVPLFFFLFLIILILVHNRKKLIETYNKY